MITVLYFARLREALGSSAEQMVLSDDMRTVGELRAVLAARGAAWAQELGQGRPVRAAVNQDIAHDDTCIADGDEVAFFPPVTGG